MKLGISLNIDVTKLDKEKFYQGKKGTYCNLTLFVDSDEQDQHGNNGGIQIAATKEEREAGEKMPYVGNAKVFWKGGGSIGAQNAGGVPAKDDFENEDIPF